MRWGSFFKRLRRINILRMMPRAGGEFAITHGADFAAQGLDADRDPVVFPQPLDQITQTPADNAVEIRLRAILYGLCQRRTLIVV